jgi:hypothetical protein
MEQKKETRATIERKIKNAVVFVPKDKDTTSIFFSDKGVRLTVTMDNAVVAFGYSQTVYSNFTASGISRPYLYTKRVIEIANESLKDIEVDGGYSFQRLLDVLNEKEDKSEYNIVTYFSWFLQNLFSPQYGIAEDEVSSFLVYEDYIHNIAKNSVLLSEHTEDVTNKQFIDSVIANIREFTDGLEESVLLHKKTDDELAKENMEAIQEQEQEQAMEVQINGASEN